MDRYRLICILVILAVSTFLYGGCSSFDSEGNPPETESTSVVPEIVSTEIQINPATARTGTLVVGVESLPAELHPFHPKDQVEKWIVEGVFEGLIESDLDGKPVGKLAESYDVSEDGLEYTFYIKDHVLFHDGTPMTAEDVLFSIEAASSPSYSGPYSESFQAINQVEMISDSAVKVTFNQSSIYHLWAFMIPILPEHIYRSDQWETFFDHTNRFIGTGPLMWNAIEYNESIELVKNEFYHEDFEGIGRVVFRKINQMEIADALVNGAVDLAIVNSDTVSRLKATKIQYVSVESVPKNEYIYIGFDHNNPTTGDRQIRQALAYGFNRTKFINDTWSGSAVPLDGPVLAHHWTYPEDQALNDYLYDIEKAKSLLESSGWVFNSESSRWYKGETELNIPIYAFNDVDWAYDLAIQLQDDWHKLGVATTIYWMDFDSLSQRAFQEKNLSVWIMAWQLPVDYDAARIFGQSSNSLNAGNYQNDEANALFDKIRTTFDETERARLISEWVSLANEDMPYIFVANPMERWAVNHKIENLKLSPYKSWILQFSDLKVQVME